LWEENFSIFSVDSMKMFLEFVLSMKPNAICQLVECFDYAANETRKEAKTIVMPLPQDVFELKESRQERKARRKREKRKKDQCLLYNSKCSWWNCASIFLVVLFSKIRLLLSEI
jgi:hypothetical protein